MTAFLTNQEIAILEPPIKNNQTHDRYSPSTLKSREICPRWENEQREDTSAADEGTCLHACTEEETFSTVVSVGDKKIDFTCNEEQAGLVQTCLDYQNQIIQGYVSEDGQDQCEFILIEKEVKLNVADLTRGTADFLILSQSEGDLIDWKFGRIPVDPPSINLQGWSYAIGVFFEHPNINELRVHFGQPRCHDLSVDQKVHTFYRENYDKMLLRIKTVIERAKDKSIAPIPDASNCLYCANKATCSALHVFALKVANNYIPEDEDKATDNFIDLIEYHSSQITDPNVMSKAWKAARIMEKWVESVKSHATKLAMSGFDLPGLQLVERAGTRKIVKGLGSANQAFDIMSEKFGLTQEEFFDACDVSFSQLTDIVGEKAQRGQKGKVKMQAENLLNDANLIDQGSPSYFLKKSK